MLVLGTEDPGPLRLEVILSLIGRGTEATRARAAATLHRAFLSRVEDLQSPPSGWRSLPDLNLHREVANGLATWSEGSNEAVRERLTHLGREASTRGKTEFGALALRAAAFAPFGNDGLHLLHENVRWALEGHGMEGISDDLTRKLIDATIPIILAPWS